MRRRLWLACLLAAPVAAQRDVAALVERLGSDDARARSEAYNELQRTRPPELVALLGKRIADFPYGGQSFGVWLLDSQPIEATRPVWKKLLDGGPPFLRAAAASALWRHGDRTTGGVLAAALRAAEGPARSAILERLSNVDDPQVLAAVRDSVQPGLDTYALAAALRCLLDAGKGRDEATIHAAERLADTADGTVGDELRAIAAAYLLDVGENRHAATLAQLLAEPRLSMHVLEPFLLRAPHLEAPVLEALTARLQAAATAADVDYPSHVLRKHAPERAVGPLRQLLGHTDENVTTAAMKALAGMVGGLDAKVLAEMLAAPAPRAALVAAETLRRMDDPRGLERVLAIVSERGTTYAEAVRVLGGFRSRRVVPPLLDALEAEDQMARQYAWSAMQRLLPDLFPYRRFDWRLCPYQPQQPAAQRAEGVRTLRAWWAALPSK